MGWAGEIGRALLAAVIKEEGDVHWHVEVDDAEDVGLDGSAEADGGVEVDQPLQQRATLVVCWNTDLEAEQPAENVGAHSQLEHVDGALAAVAVPSSSMVRRRNDNGWRRHHNRGLAIRSAAVHRDGGEEAQGNKERSLGCHCDRVCAQICSAFLANIDEHKYVSVWIFGRSYNLPPWSVSILPDCENVAFNTARVGAQTSIFTFESGSPSHSSRLKPSILLPEVGWSYLSSTWWTSKETIGTWGGESFATQGILEHLNVTKDISDYLWYTTSINISDDDVAFWSSKGVSPVLTIDQIRDVARVFVNGKLAGSQVGHWVSLKQPVQLTKGLNELTLLSEIVGLQNYGAFLEKDGAGFRGQVKLTGFPNGDIDLTHSVWTYQVGLKGEFSMMYAPEKQGCAKWSGMQIDNIQSPFTWYKTMFDSPEGTEPVAIDLGSMGKGQAWVNGHLIGRYWSLVAPESGCPSSCNYPGAYTESKCQSNCGMPTQSWYHIPREWLHGSDNLLVLFEETGGDPSKISLEVHYTKTICSRISENYYPPLSAWSRLTGGHASLDTVAPELRLQCDDGHVISQIKFASYGTSSGGCQNFSIGKCHASSTLDLVSEACVGNNKCAISVSNDVFGDPCGGVVKDLAVEAECSSPSHTKEPRDEM